MTHFERISGAAHVSAKDKTVPSGWRKATAELIEADHLAEAGAEAGHDRTRCVVAVKRVAAHIGLKAADLLLLDTLTAFSQPQDWQAGQRAIVWASNAYLMERTGFSLSTLKRHARRLVEVGVVAFKDSPNGKRWGHRDADGRIVEAYGFDLSPLAARVTEFEALAAELAEERALCQQLRRQITVARRSIRALLEMAQEQGRALGDLWEAFEALLTRLPRPGASSGMLVGLRDQFVTLFARVEDFTAEDSKREVKETSDMTPKEVKNEPHIPTTKQFHPVICNSSENEERGGVPPSKGPELTDVNRDKGKVRPGIDVEMVLNVCPEFAGWARSFGQTIRDWDSLQRVAEELWPMVGISADAWTEAQHQMGKPIAAASLALILEKVHAGEVSSPGGYLRGMAEKAGAGALHLERSFFGRRKAQAA